jgi:hypothetical protein
MKANVPSSVTVPVYPKKNLPLFLEKPDLSMYNILNILCLLNVLTFAWIRGMLGVTR